MDKFPLFILFNIEMTVFPDFRDLNFRLLNLAFFYFFIVKTHIDTTILCVYNDAGKVIRLINYLLGGD